MTLILPAPAKLNLFLHITGRRPDGYHLLQTVFTLLDHGDTLTFEADDELTLIGDAVTGDPGDNLVLRAARLLRDMSGCRAGARIQLHKALPAGGGLGGGSSDAATTLLALNHLWQLNLDTDTLAQLGLSLGADVPVFVHGRNAWAEGIGEQLTFIDLPPTDYLVVAPNVSVATSRVFNHRQLTRHTPESTVAAFLEPGSHAAFRNDCEPVTEQLFPQVHEALDWLKQHAGNSRMTGTGGCVFARMDSRENAENLLARLPSEWSGFVARSCNLSPTHQALAALRRDSNG